MTYIELNYKSFEKKLHTLSGIALLVDDRICLVLPKKFKDKKKYSIPKGHIEKGLNPYESALMELKEETGISMSSRSPDAYFNYRYKKNSIPKNLNVYIIILSAEEFSQITIDSRNKKEIKKVKFVKKDKAIDLVESKFKDLIQDIYSHIEQLKVI